MEKRLDTPCGPITGTGCQWPGVAAFKGIRYAEAGRWEYPRLVTHWDGIYDASQYGSCSYQPRAFYNEADVPEKAFYYNEFRKGEQYTYDEDCLFLNIWTPEDAAPGSRLPVLFYIHGGGFTGGCGHEKHFDGPVWPVHGVIGVTINYRLGPMGFVCLPELAKEAGHTGNYALYDQLAALQWVHANISAFGGDPDNITIMGQSAGGMSVQQLCFSPLAQPYFARAVMCSGAGVMKAMPAARPEDHYAFWQDVMARAGCENLEQLRAVSPAVLFDAWNSAKQADPKSGMAAAPVLDGRFMPKSGADTLAAGEQKNSPYLIGTTSEDVAPPIFFKMARDYCRAQADQGKQPGYCYFFDRQLPGDSNGAWHSSDLWYWFGTLANCWRPMTQKDYALSSEMVTALMNFCRTGNPNGDGLPEWLPIRKGQNKVMRFGEKQTHMGGVNMAKLAYTMATNKAVGE